MPMGLPPSSFTLSPPAEKRTEEARKVRDKFPDRIPVRALALEASFGRRRRIVDTPAILLRGVLERSDAHPG